MHPFGSAESSSRVKPIHRVRKENYFVYSLYLLLCPHLPSCQFGRTDMILHNFDEEVLLHHLWWLEAYAGKWYLRIPFHIPNIQWHGTHTLSAMILCMSAANFPLEMNFRSEGINQKTWPWTIFINTKHQPRKREHFTAATYPTPRCELLITPRGLLYCNILYFLVFTNNCNFDSRCINLCQNCKLHWNKNCSSHF